MSSEMSFAKLIMDASIVVQLVMLILLMLSVVSWTIVFQKWSMTRAAKRDADEFESRFWSGKDMAQMYHQLVPGPGGHQGMAAIFDSGYREYSRRTTTPGHVQPDMVLESAQRGMRVAMSREINRLESHLPFLATVASASPYIGLFGTVWGIMNSFTALGNVTNATLSMVAPGIAEALIATAMGLFAAIPAVIAYNRFVNDVDRLEQRYSNFSDEFATVLQHMVYK